MEPASALAAPFLEIAGKRISSVAAWVARNFIPVVVLCLLFGSILESISREEISLDPVAAADRVVGIFGISDLTWLENGVSWLRRPEMEPLTVVAAILAGVLVYWPARYSDELAWALLIVTSVAIGENAFRLVLLGFSSVVVLLFLAAVVNRNQDSSLGKRLWFNPSFVLVPAVGGFAGWVITPFVPLLHAFHGISNTMTYEPREPMPPTGAI
ncbi:MAG: hypothetical protein ACK5LO_03455 [Leucobacter sp.]